MTIIKSEMALVEGGGGVEGDVGSTWLLCAGDKCGVTMILHA